MNKKVLLCDFDTPLFQSAVVIQESPVVASHKISRRKKEYKNVTEFRTWLKSDAGKGYAEDDFDLQAYPRLKAGAEVSHALHTVKLKIEELQKLPWVSDVRLFVGGEGNYRKDLFPFYKATRGEKPIVFQEVYDYVTTKYKDIVTITHGIEAEDAVVTLAYPSYLKARKLKNKEGMDVVIGGIDKDLNQCPGWRYNYAKPDDGVYWIDSLTAWKSFCKQMLIGDTTDDIPGLTALGDEQKKKYSLKVKSIGEKTAENLLAPLSTEKECSELIVELYRGAAFGGANGYSEWVEQMDMNGVLLWLQREEGQRFSFSEYVKQQGVSL